MSFACVKGRGECSGCMACQDTLTEYEEEMLCDAEHTVTSVYKELIRPVKIKIDEIRERLEDAEAQYQEAQDNIPEGLEDTSEYANLEHNLEAIQKALDYLIDVEEGIDDLIG